MSLAMTAVGKPGRPGPPGTHRDDYPNVAAWLAGADSSHWWVRLLDTRRDSAVTPPTMADMVLGPLEFLVQAVRGASPKRLDQFVSTRFRDPHPANLLSARLELLCAASLAIWRVPFEFGGKAEPDLTWNPGTSAQGRLEIHRGAFSVFDDLQQALDKETRRQGGDPHGPARRMAARRSRPQPPAHPHLERHRRGSRIRRGSGRRDARASRGRHRRR